MPGMFYFAYQYKRLRLIKSFTVFLLYKKFQSYEMHIHQNLSEYFSVLMKRITWNICTKANYMMNDDYFSARKSDTDQQKQQKTKA